MLSLGSSFRQAFSALSLASSSRSPILQQVRHKTLAPRRTKYRKAHKGRVPIRLGGSVKGTVLENGDYGLRVKEPARLSSKHLETAEAALKRGLKAIRGSSIYFRVFPDIPVCVKGNETRMGKGKGSFEYWSCRAPVGKVVLEIGGPNLTPEMAASVLKLAAAKLPVRTEMIDKAASKRLGSAKLPQEASAAETPRVMTAEQAMLLAADKKAATSAAAEETA